MIVPYFNCLLCAHQGSSFEGPELELVSTFFEEYFADSSSAGKDVCIFIDHVGAGEKKSLKETFKKEVETVLTKSKLEIRKVNNTFTRNKEISLMHEALSALTIMQPLSAKHPVRLENLCLLTHYFSAFRSSAEMK
jgi:hypothetical protein